MPTFEVKSVTTVYETHRVDADDERDAFWALMLNAPPYVRRSEKQEVYSVREVTE